MPDLSSQLQQNEAWIEHLHVAEGLARAEARQCPGRETSQTLVTGNLQMQDCVQTDDRHGLSAFMLVCSVNQREVTLRPGKGGTQTKFV